LRRSHDLQHLARARVRNAVDATFAGEEEKRAMHERITSAVAELRGTPRS
jgi:hypothetical protein